MIKEDKNLTVKKMVNQNDKTLIKILWVTEYPPSKQVFAGWPLKGEELSNDGKPFGSGVRRSRVGDATELNSLPIPLFYSGD
jgi:hypothetical protein